VQAGVRRGNGQWQARSRCVRSITRRNPGVTPVQAGRWHRQVLGNVPRCSAGIPGPAGVQVPGGGPHRVRAGGTRGRRQA